MVPLFFGCRWMIIPVQIFSSEWYMDGCGALMHFSLIPYQPLEFFQWTRSNQVRCKCPLSLTFDFVYRLLCSNFSGNVKWAFPAHPKTSHRLNTNDCSFVNESTAFANGLVSIQEDGTVIMKADDTSNLASGVFRDRWVVFILSLCVFFFGFSESTLFAHSVRIFSQTTYNNGLFILDLNTAPWGCGTSPVHVLVGAPILTLLLLKLSGLLFGP